MTALPNPFRSSAFNINRICGLGVVWLVLISPFFSVIHVHEPGVNHEWRSFHNLDQAIQHENLHYTEKELNQSDPENQNHHHHTLSTSLVLRPKTIVPILVTIVFATVMFFSIYRETFPLQNPIRSYRLHNTPSLFHQKVLLRI